MKNQEIFDFLVNLSIPYFGLLEGDAVKPIQMILNVEPLNRPQREALVGLRRKETFWCSA